MATTTRTITIPPQLDPVAVLGPVDEVIREVERAFPDLTIIVRGNRVAIVSRSKQTEAQAAQAEDLVNTIIQAAYTAPMDADTVRRMLDQNVLKNHVRLEHPGHGPVRDKLAQSTSNERAHARSAGSHDPTYRKPTVPGVITFAAGVPVRAKTAGQVAYVNAIESHMVDFTVTSFIASISFLKKGLPFGKPFLHISNILYVEMNHAILMCRERRISPLHHQT